MRFLDTDTACDAATTWGVEVDGRLYGKVSQTPSRRYVVTDAGPYCRTPRGDHASREAAARALIVTRRACPAEQIDPVTGLMQIERDVLALEGRPESAPSDAERDMTAAQLGISPTLYRQIMRRMRNDARVVVYYPLAAKRLHAEHEAALSRTARLRRPVAAQLVRAS